VANDLTNCARQTDIRLSDSNDDDNVEANDCLGLYILAQKHSGVDYHFLNNKGFCRNRVTNSRQLNSTTEKTADLAQ
jgi:hypothetical protein